jgi:excisionase family DNA binding protein
MRERQGVRMPKFDQAYPAEKRGFTAAEARRYLGIGKSKFFDLLNSGQLKARRDGGRLLFLRSDLDNYLDRLPIRGATDHARATRSARSCRT